MIAEIKRRQAIKDLTLMLVHLTSFKDPRFADSPEMLPIAWKNYDWDAIDALCDENLLYQRNKSNKSICITDEGMATAEELLKKYGRE